MSSTVFGVGLQPTRGHQKKKEVGSELASSIISPR